jgi:hypothetical protein
MQHRQCHCDPRQAVAANADPSRSADDYAAGRADARNDAGP